MTAPAAVLFDVDGTLAETERDGHRPAFNRAFAEHDLGLHWTPEHYTRLLRIPGGRQRIAADLRERGVPAVEADRTAAAVHRTKTALFAEHARAGTIPARPGVRTLVADLRRCGARIGVVTTGRREWAEPLVRHLIGDVAGELDVAVYGDDVTALKPDPQAYRRALRGLGMPAACVVAVEDSAPGVAAALGAGLVTVVVRSEPTAGHDVRGAALVRDSFDGGPPLDAALFGELLAAADDQRFAQRRSSCRRRSA
ncbi:HAD-IA family hydrolase [Pseudonocardia parietis]|uniref:HAD superfamily hydrolase (TIGR01509 family) n=1 Tax=Pseudonocardia parietis TaxID=570936 RepID=A0ABS4VRF0_9PSEU|nr:HAD-IA family hydrolase [Pseudonocardia parietis]MBP2366144.1 HAD superfamily hydrolase (TIGR01509 family) [Pseudonocardia parietis]